MKRIYFFDIDNTLLDHQTKAIPDSALTAIDGLKRAGHTVVIATGRGLGQAKQAVDLISPRYIISQNGARILELVDAEKDVKEAKEVMAVPLAREPLKALFAWMDEQGHYYGVNDGRFAHISAAVPIVTQPLRLVETASTDDVGWYLEHDVYQGWLFYDESLDATLTPQILERFPDFDLVRWHKTAVDLLPKGVNKWTGCQWVMAQTGFHADQAIAFGDGLNDMEMLQGVGLGIAMDNGHPTLKAIAKRIAPALHLDGIATMLAELSAAH